MATVLVTLTRPSGKMTRVAIYKESDYHARLFKSELEKRGYFHTEGTTTEHFTPDQIQVEIPKE